MRKLFHRKPLDRLGGETRLVDILKIVYDSWVTMKADFERSLTTESTFAFLETMIVKSRELDYNLAEAKKRDTV